MKSPLREMAGVMVVSDIMNNALQFMKSFYILLVRGEIE
jgi:hypothetical protein